MPDEYKLEQRKSKKTHTLLTPANGGNEHKIGKSIKCEDFSSKGQSDMLCLEIHQAVKAESFRDRQGPSRLQ